MSARSRRRQPNSNGEVTLVSCLINGKPGVAIVLMEHVGEGKVGVMPLFVAITSDMDIAFEGEVGGGSGEGGGPAPRVQCRKGYHPDVI